MRVKLNICQLKLQRGLMERLIRYINAYARLSFSNTFLEEQYKKEQLKEFLPQNILVAKIAILLYLTYVPLTYFLMVKNELLLLTFIAFLGILGAASLIYLQPRPIFNKYPYLILFNTAFLVGIAPILYYILTSNDRALFQVDILLPIIGIFTMYGVGFSFALLIVLSIIGSSCLLSTFIGISTIDTYAALYVLVAGGLVTGVASYFIEKSHRNLFTAKRKSDEFKFMVENAQDSIAVFDLDNMKYRYANKIAIGCTGCSSEKIIGKSISDVHPELSYDVIKSIKQRLDTEGSFSEVYKLYDKEKEAFYYAHVVIQYGFFEGEKVIITFSSDATPQKEAEMKLQDMALQDALTGLSNRHNFDETSKQQINLALRYKHPLSLIICDIDHFKKINDQFGHLEGDQVLKHIADTIRNTVRESDIVARWGGEEFAILLPNTDQEDAHMVAEKIRENVEMLHIDKIGKVTLSCGSATFQKDDTQMTWFHRADTALYRAKEAGRNQVHTA